MTPIDKANMKRNLTELYILEVMFMLGLILKGLYDDDKDKDSAYKITKNLLNRCMDDSLFYISPTSFENVVKNPIPVFRVMTDVTNAGKATFKYMIKDDYSGEQSINQVSKVLPIFNLYNKIRTISEKEL
jgi:hypothetical protein